MPDDWLGVALRFALDLDLMLLFGTPLFSVYGLRAGEGASAFLQRYERAAWAAAVVGIALSAWGLVETAKSMTGATTYAELTGDVFREMLATTAIGAAWVVRMAALAAWRAVAILLRGHVVWRGIGLAALGAVALTTVAWAGHGAMDDGTRGYIHLLIDSVHLLAAGMWMGALLGFALLASANRTSARQDVQMLSHAATGFAPIGTGIVITLAVTGVINYVLVVGPVIAPLFTAPYGRLLLTKLTLFAAMLGLAARHRYRLSPRLAEAVSVGDYAPALGLLRRSLRLELGLGVLILALVAWLGVLSPFPD